MNKKENADKDQTSDPSIRTELFFQLFVGCQNHLYALILVMVHNESDAEDILQETAAIMWEKFGEFEAGRSFLAWGVGIARNKALDFHRKTQRSRARLGHKTYEQIIQRATHAADRIADRSEALKACQKKLKESDRRIIFMRYEKNLPIKTIADRLGLSTSGLYKNMSRILNLLQQCIKMTLAQKGFM